jgi:hypothetical protein
MKLRVGGYTLDLGRVRSDGFRNVARERMTNWRALLPSLRRAKIQCVVNDTRLLVQPDDPNQLLMLWMNEAG